MDINTGKLADNDRFKVEYYRTHREKRANMCDVLDIAENIGIAKGIAEGKYKMAVEAAIKFLKLGKLTPEEIAQGVELPLEEVIALSDQLRLRLFK